MGHSHQHVALDRGAHHAVELELQATLLRLGQRYCRAHLAYQFRAIAQQEKQQVQHDEKAHQEIKRTLAEAERLGGKELTALHRALDDLFPQPFEVAHAKTVEQLLEIRR